MDTTYTGIHTVVAAGDYITADTTGSRNTFVAVAVEAQPAINIPTLVCSVMRTDGA